MQLPAGYVPILCMGEAGSAGRIAIEWQRPGQPAFGPIADSILFHFPEPAGS